MEGGFKQDGQDKSNDELEIRNAELKTNCLTSSFIILKSSVLFILSIPVNSFF
jgi:hypothetical protein